MGSLFGKTPTPKAIEPPPPPEIAAPSTMIDPTKQRRALAGTSTMLTGPGGLGPSVGTGGSTLLGR